MRFRQRVAVQEPTEVRSNTGAVSWTYETMTGLESVPANVQAVTNERRDPEATITEDLFAIDLGGEHPELRPEMVILDGEAVYDVIRVVPTIRREITSLRAKRVAI